MVICHYPLSPTDQSYVTYFQYWWIIIVICHYPFPSGVRSQPPDSVYRWIITGIVIGYYPLPPTVRPQPPDILYRWMITLNCHYPLPQTNHSHLTLPVIYKQTFNSGIQNTFHIKDKSFIKHSYSKISFKYHRHNG